MTDPRPGQAHAGAALHRLRALFPHPVLSLQLGLTWLVLSHSLAPVHCLAAVLLAWAVPRLLAPFLAPASRLYWPAVMRLTLIVLWDIIVANLTVARLTLGPIDRSRPAWLRVPLATDHPRVNALFASIITMTPGTVSAVIDEERGMLLVHALDCADAQAMVAEMKSRYEASLLRVFRVDLASHGPSTRGGRT
jgi:multicomponent K+:H+ antiporter subunit E